MEKVGVAVNLCVCFGKILAIFPHFFHANAKTVPKARHNCFIPTLLLYRLSVVLHRSYKKEQEIVSDPVPSITPFLDT
jgi:predicted nucleic-acid-binding protein